jgi:hypothetical protein
VAGRQAGADRTRCCPALKMPTRASLGVPIWGV